jgi:16S rRNA G966 N2-methylase RsmD
MSAPTDQKSPSEVAVVVTVPSDQMKKLDEWINLVHNALPKGAQVWHVRRGIYDEGEGEQKISFLAAISHCNTLYTQSTECWTASVFSVAGQTTVRLIPPEPKPFPPMVLHEAKTLSAKFRMPDYTKILCTNDSRYVSLMPWHIPDLINKLAPLEKTPPKKIIDMTAHVGVDAANLALTFPDAYVYAVELNPQTHALLATNLKALGVKGEAVCGNGVDFALKHATEVDMVYIDPPWEGGAEYQKFKNVSLTLTDGGGCLWEMPDLVAALRKKNPRLTVIVKTPLNYDKKKSLQPMQEIRNYKGGVFTRPSYLLSIHCT